MSHTDSGCRSGEAADRDLESLALRARNGDRAAVERFLEAARIRVFRWALVRATSADEAEDLAQESLLRVGRRLDSFRGSGRMSSWLYRVVERTHLDMLRRKGVRRRAEERHLNGRDEVEVASPPDVPAAAEAERLVRRFFAELSERQRTVVDLVDLRGHSPKEVAEMLELEPSTVRVHLLRGRRRLRRIILEEGAGDA